MKLENPGILSEASLTISLTADTGFPDRHSPCNHRYADASRIERTGSF